MDPYPSTPNATPNLPEIRVLERTIMRQMQLIAPWSM